MKYAVGLAWSTGSIAAIALIVLLGMNLTIWSGPNLDISAKGSEAKVESVVRVDALWQQWVGENSMFVKEIPADQSLNGDVAKATHRQFHR